jgi:hypothetical protein
MSATPVLYESDYVEKRSRLTTFFRWLLAIPHWVVLTLWGIVASFAVFFAWFAIVITGKWPRGLYDFTASYVRYMTAANGYMNLLTDEYPPFSGDTDRYPVRLLIGEPKPSYSRVTALFRMILLIPVMIISWVMSIVASIGVLVSWFVIVITGKQPRGLQEMIDLGIGYMMRANAYALLVSEEFPPISNEPPILGPGRVARADLTSPSPSGSFTPPVAPERPADLPPAPPTPPPPDPFGRED